MAGRLTKEMKRHLVKYIKKVDVAWTGWKVSERASVAEVHRQLTAARHLSANPKMEVVETLPIQDTTPRIKIVLQDDRVVEFEDTRGVSATEILDAFYTQASEIDAQWDEEGKSIDDMM